MTANANPPKSPLQSPPQSPPQSPKELLGKTIVVTGGSRGIGKAMAQEFALRGARLVLFARTRSELEATAQEIHAETRADVQIVVGDAALATDVERLFKETERRSGPAHGLVCSSAIFGPIGSFETLSIEEWEASLRINLLGPVYCAHRFIPGMKERGSGRILFLTGGSQGAMSHFSAYVSAKGAINRLTETLGAELAPHGVFLNAMFPGPVNTRLLDVMLAAGPEKTGAQTYAESLRRKEQGGAPPEKAAELACYLMSERSRGLAGRILSAVWDRYENLQDLEPLSQTDLYTMRRVIRPDGGTR